MSTAPSSAREKFAFIDCIRGYAVLLVIVFHTTLVFPELPNPIRRFTYEGRLGVQLFFVASAVTLMLSLEHERARTGRFNARAFYIRRWTRIAPAYFLAGLIYNLVWPLDMLSPYSVLASLLFLNAWHPVPIGAVWGQPPFVPGGWSIGVEFTFYFLFPLLAAWFRRPGQAVVLFVGSFVIAALVNPLARDFLATSYNYKDAEQFAIWWPVNNMPIFMLGIVVYYGVSAIVHPPAGHVSTRLVRAQGLLIALSLLGFAGLSYITTPAYITVASFIPPLEILSGTLFMLFVLALSLPRSTVFVNRAAQAMGKVSFSGYLSHFAVLRLLPERFPETFHVRSTGYEAIAAFGVTAIIVVLVTFAVSWLVYRFIEQPGIELGRRLTSTPAATPASRAVTG